MSTMARFYDAFQRRDADAMCACYHPQAQFSDPVFPRLDARQVCGMWHMLLNAGNDLRITYVVVEETGDRGSVVWDAHYTFNRTGRRVHNRITARFTFKDGLILTHVDRFDFWRWSRQALGMPGWLLGWSPLIRKKVQDMASGALARAMHDR
jgi:ketosteroid isomerase-like protein